MPKSVNIASAAKMRLCFPLLAFFCTLSPSSSQVWCRGKTSCSRGNWMVEVCVRLQVLINDRNGASCSYLLNTSHHTYILQGIHSPKRREGIILRPCFASGRGLLYTSAFWMQEPLWWFQVLHIKQTFSYILQYLPFIRSDIRLDWALTVYEVSIPPIASVFHVDLWKSAQRWVRLSGLPTVGGLGSGEVARKAKSQV